MKNNILTALILSITIGISAQNVKKPYKMLEKGDYEKAKELFMKNLTENKEHVASNFGMAMILADDKSPYFNIVDSWQYIEIIDGRSNELNQDEIEILGEYFLETEVRKTSRPVKKKIDIAIEAVESRLIKYIREENDLEAVYAVLEKYPDYRHYDNVIHIRNQFEFRKYEKMNTKAGYEEFIAKFPEAAQVPKAERYRNKMAFEEAKAENSVLSYNKYIKDYPGSVHLQQAIKLRNTAAFAEAKSKHSLAAYEGFIALYPDALEIPEARKYQHELMYEKAKRIKSLQAYNEFIRMYPDGAYYIDVFNLKAEDLGHQYFQTLGFSSNDLNWVKALDNNEFIDEAQAFAITPQGEHVIAGTTRANDTSFTDAWIIKLDANGKMLWNKTIGQPFNDNVSDVLITSDNQIVVVGSTQILSDSAKYMGWMFMLEEDGSRRWNKNLGEINIAASAISPNNKIYLSTYVDDTISDQFYIQAMNLEGNKIWERDYVRKGVFTSICFNNDGNVFLAGDKWFTYSDPKFYLNWEDTLTSRGTIKLASLNTSSIAFISADSAHIKLFNYDTEGTLRNSSSINSNSVEEIKDLIVLSNGNILVLSNNVAASRLRKFNNSAKSSGNMDITNTFKIIAVEENNSGGVSYLLKGDDYLIINFSSSGI